LISSFNFAALAHQIVVGADDEVGGAVCDVGRRHLSSPIRCFTILSILDRFRGKSRDYEMQTNHVCGVSSTLPPLCAAFAIASLTWFSSAFGNLRSRCVLVRNMCPLGQPAAEGNVLARRLVERDQKIIGRDARCNHCIVQGFQQSQYLFLGATRNKRDLQHNQIIGIV
jgi:hypothetical protein